MKTCFHRLSFKLYLPIPRTAHFGYIYICICNESAYVLYIVLLISFILTTYVPQGPFGPIWISTFSATGPIWAYLEKKKIFFLKIQIKCYRFSVYFISYSSLIFLSKGNNIENLQRQLSLSMAEWVMFWLLNRPSASLVWIPLSAIDEFCLQIYTRMLLPDLRINLCTCIHVLYISHELFFTCFL